MKGQGTGKNGRQAVAPSRGRGSVRSASSAAPRGSRPASVARGARAASSRSEAPAPPIKSGAKTIARVSSQKSASQRGRGGIKEGAKLPTKKELDSRSRAHSRAAQSKQKRQQQQTEAELVESEEGGDGGSEAHIWFSLLIFFIAGYLFLCTISYLMYWQQDAALASMGMDNITSVAETQNWGGRLGATTGALLIGSWLGLSGVLVPVYLFMLGLRILRVETLRFRRSMPALLAIIFVSSLALGHVYGTSGEVFGSGWGGAGGIYVSEWLEAIIGPEGTSLLIIFLVLGVLYYSFAGWVKRVSRHVAWYFERRAQKRREAFMWAKARREAAAMSQPALSEELQQRLAQAQESNEEQSADKNEEQNGESDEAHRDESFSGEQDSATEQSEQPAVEDDDAEDDGAEDGNAESNGCNQEHSGDTEAAEKDCDVAAATEQSSESKNSDSIIALEGGITGYIYGYDEAGAAMYLYAEAQMLRDSVAQLSAEVSMPAVEEEKEEFFVVERPTEQEEDSEQKTPQTSAPTPPTTTVEQEMAIHYETPLGVEPPVSAAPVSPEPATTPPAAENTIGFDVQKSDEEQKLAQHKIDTMSLYDPTAELPKYRKPPVDLLHDHTRKVEVSDEELQANKDRIIHTLLTFGIKIDSIKATIGPTVTLYEIVPAPGVRISKIKNLENDIALALAALGIRIIAPIPGKGTIGIEVPNTQKETVSMNSVIRAVKFQKMKAELPIALGKTIQNETYVIDLAKMPHLLVAGATGQGKSVGLNAIITSLLYKKHPSELKFVLVDPKKVELTLYSKLEKHFLAKMEGEEEAIITDTQKVVYTLNSICKEMDARYDLLKAAQVRNIVEYNQKFTHRRLNPEKGHRYLPYFVVVIDEFADLIMTAGREVETPIARIAQLARAVGIHLIIATQRPTTNIITGVIKANFPARVAFKVSSMIDSRTILDSPGANQLIGRGDMLVSTGSEMTRVQCAFIDTPEVEDIVNYIGEQRGYLTAYELPEYVPEGADGTGPKDVDMTRKDPLFEEVARYVVNAQSGSASTIQRKFSIGFNRAGRIIDQLEVAGIVGPQVGSKPRQVMIQDPISLEMMLGD